MQKRVRRKIQAQRTATPKEKSWYKWMWFFKARTSREPGRTFSNPGSLFENMLVYSTSGWSYMRPAIITKLSSNIKQRKCLLCAQNWPLNHGSAIRFLSVYSETNTIISNEGDHEPIFGTDSYLESNSFSKFRITSVGIYSKYNLLLYYTLAQVLVSIPLHHIVLFTTLGLH